MLGRVLAPEASASLTESVHRRMRIVSCSGSILVKAGGQVAGGGVKGHKNRFEIEVDEEFTFTESQATTKETTSEATTETPDGTTTTVTTTTGSAEATAEASSSVTVREIGEVPGRGPCASSVVAEQERSVEA